MEGPMMNMDGMVDKPENYGLPAGWTEYMQGMMTFVRVLPADKYDEVMRLVAEAKPDKSSTPKSEPSAMPMHHHPGMSM
jgi:manganese oxidase